MNMAFFESHMKRPTAAAAEAGQHRKSDAEYSIRMHWEVGTGYCIVGLGAGFWARGPRSRLGFQLSRRASRGGDNNTCATTKQPKPLDSGEK